MKCKLCGRVLDELDYADHCAEGMSVLDANAAERYPDACIQRAVARRAAHKEAIHKLLGMLQGAMPDTHFASDSRIRYARTVRDNL